MSLESEYPALPGSWWELWFAWHPVKLVTGRWAWLKVVGRREVLTVRGDGSPVASVAYEVYFAKHYAPAVWALVDKT